MASFAGQYPNGLRMGVEAACGEVRDTQCNYQLDAQDNRGAPATGTTIAQKQLAQGFDVYISGLSNVTQAFAPQISATGKPHFIVAFDSELLKNDPNKLRVLPHLRLESPLWITYAKMQHAKRVFIMHANFPAYHEQYSKFIEPGLKSLGVVYQREVYDFGAADFRTLALKAAAYKPDLVFFTSLASDLLRGIEALRTNRITGDGQIMCTMDFVDLLHADIDRTTLQGITFATPIFEFPEMAAKAQNWTNKFKRRFGKSPSYVDAYAFETGRMLVFAKDKTDSLNTASIKQLLPWVGIVGTLGLDQFNDLSTTLSLATVDASGNIVEIK